LIKNFITLLIAQSFSGTTLNSVTENTDFAFRGEPPKSFPYYNTITGICKMENGKSLKKVRKIPFFLIKEQ